MLTLTNQVKYRSGAIKNGYADPYFNGQNREFSLNIRFNPFLKQWYLEVFKADHKVRAYLPHKTIGLTVKQVGAIFRANKIFTWSKDGFSKTIDRKGLIE